ncbi:hypothetical protein FNF29_02638 [Cafeteria roenbergensis]|uniref:Uncharacterized protein n=1 Tax=Cafeteria roenbergensis TaxID=33653 RepID=A0A5A8CLV1_CAFRO|nr:hypothetical protein FNF29_02638 [Cafeteria roenbergensis]|eukprot:KAA0154015.1 hypothetical protein FNF29_02638 [Cafeteria roenbergensis]
MAATTVGGSAPCSDTWRSTNELISSNGEMLAPSDSVRETLARKANFVAQNVSPMLESLVQLVVAHGCRSEAGVLDDDALLRLLHSRCGEPLRDSDFAGETDAEDGTEDAAEAAAEGDAAGAGGLCAALASGMPGVDEGVTGRGMGELMPRLVEAFLVKCAAEEPEDVAAWAKAFFAGCQEAASKGELDAFLRFEFRPHADPARG